MKCGDNVQFTPVLYHVSAIFGHTGGKACGMTGPEDIYEEFKFKTRVLEIINGHDATNADSKTFCPHTIHR